MQIRTGAIRAVAGSGIDVSTQGPEAERGGDTGARSKAVLLRRLGSPLAANGRNDQARRHLEHHFQIHDTRLSALQMLKYG